MLEVSEVGNRVQKEQYKAAVPELRVGLVNAQYDLRNADFPVVIWIAGDDRIAANQMVNRLNEWLDTRFVTTRVFAEQTQEEAERPTLWRLWRALPPKGQIAIFAGGLMRAATMRAMATWARSSSASGCGTSRRCRSELVADGALVLKFFLHTPEKKQRKKLKKAENDPEIGWWIDQRDWAALERMSPTLPIAERILRETSAPGAPWTIVESTDSRYRDLTVARTILAAITARLAQQPRQRTRRWRSRCSAISRAQATVLSGVDLTSAARQGRLPPGTGRQQRKLYAWRIEARNRGDQHGAGVRGLGRRRQGWGDPAGDRVARGRATTG